jgi:multiple sugar transport system permease protein
VIGPFSRRRPLPLVLAYAALLLVSLFCLLPFFWMLVTSFKTEAETFRSPPTWLPLEPTIEAYREIWTIKPFALYFWNSTVISMAAALGSTLLGALAGYGFSRFRFGGKGLLLAVFLTSQMLPGVLLIGPYFRLMGQLGLYNTHAGLAIGLASICLPFCVWMSKGFVEAVPPELDEAAMVDGSSRLGAFWRVVLPIIAPGLTATLLFGFLLAWGDLLWALVLTSREEMGTVTLGVARMVGEFRIAWPMLMAGSLLGALPSVIFYVALQRFLISGMTAGAVKQ